MEYCPAFNELKEAYSKERGFEISDDQFAGLVYTFPSALVACADHTFDRYERDYLKIVPAELATGFNDTAAAPSAEFTPEYFSEIEYLVKNEGKWGDAFLDALRCQLKDSENAKNAIFEMMWRTADSSADISAAERAKIDEISRVLGL